MRLYGLIYLLSFPGGRRMIYAYGNLGPEVEALPTERTFDTKTSDTLCRATCLQYGPMVGQDCKYLWVATKGKPFSFDFD